MSAAAAPTSTGGQKITLAATLAIWAIVLVCLARIATASVDYQWDFRVFHKAPAVLAAGGNPYAPSDLQVDGLSYLYPPLALYAFRPLSALPFELAYVLWFGLKVLALAALIRVWHRNFEALSSTPLMVAFFVFAFNMAILRDFTAGNIAVFEQLGLWWSFALLLHGRPHLAAVLVAVVAQFKLMPVVFLAVLLVTNGQRGLRPFATGILTFAALLGANFVLMPELTAEYVSSFFADNPNIDERGHINPSSLAFMRDVVDLAISRGLALPDRLGSWLFVMYVAALASATVYFLWKHRDRLSQLDPRVTIYCACLLYVLTMPRVKDYTYMILLIPTLFVIRVVDKKLLVPLLLVLALLPAQMSYVPGVGRLLDWLYGYAPLLTAVVMSGLLARWIVAAQSPREPERVP